LDQPSGGGHSAGARESSEGEVAKPLEEGTANPAATPPPASPPAAPPPAAPPATSSTDQFLGAIDRIRETAKWLLTTFGVIGGALVAGTQLSDIGDAEGSNLVLAFIGALLGFGGVGIAIWITGRVLTPARVGLDDITNDSNVGRWAANDPGLLKGQAKTVDELIQRYRHTLDEYVEARRKAESDPDDTDLAQDAHARQAAYKAVENPMQMIRGMALYDRVNTAFGNALTVIGASVVIAGVGLLLFAYATGSASNEESDQEASGQVAAATGSFEAPAAVTLVPTDEGKKVLADILGKACRPQTAEALLLSQVGGTLEIASAPSGKCRAARFILEADLVALKARATAGPPGA
jgi:hypothetical protein